MTAIGFETHDHTACISDALGAAEAHCAKEKVQFTPVRRRVLEILLTEHKALGAYDILAHLAQEGMGAQPPVVYRALDFLVRNGLAHKIEKLNAYVACTVPGQAHAPAFMICRRCGNVVEATSDDSPSGLDQMAHDAGFEIERAVVEALGLCTACRAAEAV